jgi:hypothetical protein
MTFTINLSSWIIPVVVTIIAIISVSYVAFLERNDRGLLAGLGTVVTFLIAAIGTIIAWVVWGLTHLFK